jgi:hypothetical protein
LIADQSRIDDLANQNSPEYVSNLIPKIPHNASFFYNSIN